jgi:hypothetical protein
MICPPENSNEPSPDGTISFSATSRSPRTTLPATTSNVITIAIFFIPFGQLSGMAS